MKKSLDEKKQKWEEARAKYVISASFRFTYFFPSLLLYIWKMKGHQYRFISIVTLLFWKY